MHETRNQHAQSLTLLVGEIVISITSTNRKQKNKPRTQFLTQTQFQVTSRPSKKWPVLTFHQFRDRQKKVTQTRYLNTSEIVQRDTTNSVLYDSELARRNTTNSVLNGSELVERTPRTRYFMIPNSLKETHELGTRMAPNLSNQSTETWYSKDSEYSSNEHAELSVLNDPEVAVCTPGTRYSNWSYHSYRPPGTWYLVFPMNFW